MFKIYDIHSHLNHADFESDLDQVISDMEEKVCVTNCVGYDIESSKRAIEIASMSDNIHPIVGIHPDQAMSGCDVSLIRDMAEVNSEIVGIGECGFDYFRSSRALVFAAQEKLFREQCSLAHELGLPVMIHTRDKKDMYRSYYDAISVLDDFDGLRAHFHFFVGNLDVLKEIIMRGHTISFTGVITFTKDYDEVIKSAPLSSVLIETDSPWVAPVPYRGKRALPWMAQEVAKKIVKLHGVSAEEALSVFNDNAKRVFLK